MVGLQHVFKRPAARESPKAMEPPAVSRFLYRDTIIGECNRNPFSLSCMAKSSNFSNLQPLGALFSASSLWYWHHRGPAFADCASGRRLGGAAGLAQPSRHRTVVYGVDGGGGNLL